MDYINPFIKVNAGGIPRLLSYKVTVDTNDLIFDFHNHRFLNYPYAGLLILKLPAVATAPTTAGKVYFTTEGNNKVQLLDNTGTGVASTNDRIADGGVFIGWYSDNLLLLLDNLG